MSLRKQVIIATSANARYALGAFVALKSALLHAPATEDSIQLVILDGGLSNREWDLITGELNRLGKRIVIHRLVPDLTIFKNLPHDYGNSLMAYARLALAWMLPDTVERVLYCDSDVVFLRDWSPLWDLDLEGCVVAATRCPVVQTLGREELPLADLGLPADAPYLQSGVMVIDFPRWREEQVSERAVSYLQRFPLTGTALGSECVEHSITREVA